MDYIELAQSPACNVFPLEREEIQNINVLTVKDRTKRVALIRKEGKSFQSASVIVMRRGFLNGYILKKDFKVHDDDEATFIEVNLPNKKLDLSAIEFGMKYPPSRKFKQDKLDDLQKMRPF